MRNIIIVAVLACLTACQNGPKPPIASGSRYMVNDEKTEQILTLQKSLSEAQELLLVCEHLEAGQGDCSKQNMEPVIFKIPFVLNSSILNIDNQLKETLIDKAQKAKRIDIKGRTDAVHPSPNDEAIAMERAKQARNLLIRAGISPLKIYLNYTSGTEYALDNSSPEGKDQNRRVEIMMYLDDSI